MSHEQYDYGEEEGDDEEDEESVHKQMLAQPFYTYDDQTDEQYYIIDHDSYGDHPNSVDPTANTHFDPTPQPYLDQDVSSIEASTVEAVKQRLINDP